MYDFQPDYRYVLGAARNIEAPRLPLYEHIMSYSVLETIIGRPFAALFDGDERDCEEFIRVYADFLKTHGYDIIPFECCVTGIFPGGGALGRHVKGAIQDRADFECYPWDELPERFFQENGKRFVALRKMMPEGMKAVGGPGNGVFECVQDLTGYIDLCYIREDDPELYADLFLKIGEVMSRIWNRFLREYGDAYCVCRFGDDLGFATATLLAPEDIRKHIIPQYRKIIDAVHRAGSPSCCTAAARSST